MSPASASTTVRYRIRPLNRNEHVLEINVYVPSAQIAPNAPLQVQWPTWIPGSYLIREYARHVLRVNATCDGKPVALTQTDKCTWQCVPSLAASVAFTFQVYAFDRSVRGAFLDADRMYFNGAAVFPQVLGHAGAIEIDLVDDTPPAAARIATTMPPLSVDELGRGRYRVADYDALLDHPVEISEQVRAEFRVAGISHTLVVTAAPATDLQRVIRDLEKICAEHVRMFHGDGPPPFTQYLFMLSVVPDGYGGLEHRDSTSLVCAPGDLPIAGDPAISEGYLQLLGLMSHEYFHAWNVKRIRPQSFVPYDLTREVSTDQLWLYEGFTSYYDDLALVRSGVITPEDYLRLIGRNLSALARTPGRHVQSVRESGTRAWTKYYRADENAPNALVSYYLKGGLVALLMDLTLRSQNNTSLDEIMRALFAQWQSNPDRYSGTPDDALEAHMEAHTGQSWRSYFSRYVEGTDPLPIESALAAFGVRVRWRPSHGSGDRGGLPDKMPPFGTHFPALGLVVVEGERVKSVLSGSAAARAGIASGDHIVAVNKRRAVGATLGDTLSRTRVGDDLLLHVFRDQKLREFVLKVPSAQLDTAWCEIDTEMPTPAAARRASWLTGST